MKKGVLCVLIIVLMALAKAGGAGTGAPAVSPVFAQIETHETLYATETAGPEAPARGSVEAEPPSVDTEEDGAPEEKRLEATETGSCSAWAEELYSEPSLAADIVGSVKFGETVFVIERDAPEGWHHILFNDASAYIIAESVRLAAYPSNEPAPYPHVDPDKPMVALTFDDGPGKATPRILDALKEYGGRATFFVLGSRLETYRDTLVRMAAEGHEIACHGWSHKSMRRLEREDITHEIAATNELIKEYTGGYIVRLLRPPYGSIDDSVQEVCAGQDMVVVLWSVDTNDWETNSSAATYNRMTRGDKHGAIVLSHDIYNSTGKASEKAIPKLIEKGYQLVTVSELLYFSGMECIPGEIYREGVSGDVS